MDKSMYSIMLMNNVVKEIDNLAYEQNTNRSNIINQILAEYLSIKTPEMYIKEVFDLMTAHMEQLSGFKIQASPSDFIILIKSPLDYKYRPTIKYSIELYRINDTHMGELRVAFRTQHNELLKRLADFFEIWVKIEIYYIHKYFNKNSIKYNIEEGRFRRSFMIPKSSDSLNTDIVSRAIGEYIEMFDDILKLYLYDTQVCSEDLEKKYVEYLNDGLIII